MMNPLVDNISWLGHASFRIKDQLAIYIDPWKIVNPEPADIILITHEHYDHYSIQDITQIANENTIVIAPFRIDDSLQVTKKMLKPQETVVVNGRKISAVPAYNVNKPFHPRSNNWAGYVIELSDGRTLYHTGDSDYIPEMEDIEADIVLAAVDGTYTMNSREAALLVNKIHPRVAVPMHYGDVAGKQDDAREFKKHVTGEVVVLSPTV